MTATDDQAFRLRVLGSAELRDSSGQTPRALGWGKPLALLCFLAVRGEVRRDEIVDLLWRDIEEGKARNAFRQALHRLRTALGDDIIPHDRDRLRLAPSARLSIDVADFERHVRAGQWDSAVALYTGDFLGGLHLGEPAFDFWAEQERTRLRGRYRQVLQDSVVEASSGGRWADAISRAKKLLSVAPFEPEAARLAATALLSAGRSAEALELLRQFAERTQRELGVPAHADLQVLITRLSRESFATPTEARAAVPGPGQFPSLCFVGRESELSQLLSMWQSVGEDAGALALIEGDAGIGKSRLVQELALHARTLGGALVLSGRERAAGAQLPYGIFGEALRPLVRAPGVAGASAHLLAEAARLLPEMRDTFDLPQVSAVDDEASRLRFFEGVAALIDAAAYEQKLLVTLEELQHIPPSSLDLLSYLVVRLAGAPVLFALTVRPGEASPTVITRLRAFAEDSESHSRSDVLRARRVSLGSLTNEQALAALANALASGIPLAVVEHIARQSGGNPFRLMQALKSVSAGEEPPSQPIPLRDVLHERLVGLSSTQRRVFLVLALLGRSASESLLASASHVSESACREAIRILEQQGLVEGADSGLRVTSDLASSVAIEIAGGAGRAFLSGWIAEALAREPRPQSAELARHYAVAGNAAQAFSHARRAAYDALVAGADAEAAQLFSMARTFAAGAAEQAEIEGLLDALGAGRRRLHTGAPHVPLQTDDPRVAAAHKAASSTTATVPPAAGDWQTVFPHWRTLFGAAVATLLITATVLGMRQRASDALKAARPIDTLVVTEGLANSRGAQRLAIGSLRSGFTLGSRIDRSSSDPAWVDSLPRQWTSALPDPRGRRVALARSSDRGMDLVVISRDRRDSIELLVSQRNTTPLAWSPDGKWLLATRSRRLPDGAFDAPLFAFRVDAALAAIAVDTSPRRAVIEAQWSPDGSHIAWVARVGAERQLEVFTSLADGSNVRNLSRHPADDNHIAWSSDGELLAFTSTRDNNPELYVADIVENRLIRLTQNIGQDDHAAFSPDGRTVAFESTRGGFFGVYVMPALGGEPLLVGTGVPMELVDWRGQRARFVDRLRVVAIDLPLGDSAALHVRAFDELGDSIITRAVEWRIVDSALVRFSSSGDSTSQDRFLLGTRSGLARVVATLGRWRSDTALVRVGSGSVRLIRDDFADGLAQWRALGSPGPSIGGGQPRTLVLRGNQDSESGVLSRRAVPLVPGLVVNSEIMAPWAAAPDAMTSASVSLVAAENAAVIDSTAPQFIRLASISWTADAGRMVYAVGKEIFSEPVGAAVTPTRRFTMLVESDSTVSFIVNDTTRWRSTLRLTTPQASTRAQLWISGRATNDAVTVSSASVSLAPIDGARRSPN